MTYCRKTEIVARSVAGEHVLIPIQGCTNRVYTVNGVGRWLWELLATPCSDGDLLEALVERYGISPETACVDVRHFLDEMKRMGLVEVVEGWKDIGR